MAAEDVRTWQRLPDGTTINKHVEIRKWRDTAGRFQSESERWVSPDLKNHAAAMDEGPTRNATPEGTSLDRSEPSLQRFRSFQFLGS